MRELIKAKRDNKDTYDPAKVKEIEDIEEADKDGLVKLALFYEHVRGQLGYFEGSRLKKFVEKSYAGLSFLSLA